jgi:sarcosine oxidase, subunit gamma
MTNITFNPVMQSPLHHFNLASKQEKMIDTKGVWANELALAGYIRLRGNPQNKDFYKATKKALGIELPCEPCSLLNTNFGAIYWLSTDEWLIVCALDKRAELQFALESALTGIQSQVINQSGGATTIFVQGKHACDALSHCTLYDLHALSDNKVVGTTFGKLSVFLCKNNDGYYLMFRRSYADYIWRYLERAAQPYGFGVQTIAD